MTNEEKMTVSYTAKELFGQVDKKLDVLLEKVDAKADHAALVALTDRVESLEDKSRDTEVIAKALLADKEDRFTTKQKVAMLAFAAITVILNIASLFPDLPH